jgi:tetratricopeptide (TPR) repeat protein
MKPVGCGEQPLAYWLKPGQTFGVTPLKPGDEQGRGATASAMINGVPISVEFDTSLPVSVLRLAAARRAGISTTDPGVVSAGRAYSGGRSWPSWVMPVKSFELAGEQILNTRLRVTSAEMNGADLELGADYFLSHHLYFANGQNKLYVTYAGGPVFSAYNSLPSAGHAPPTRGAPGDVAARASIAGAARLKSVPLSKRDYAGVIAYLEAAQRFAVPNSDLQHELGFDFLEADDPSAAVKALDLWLTAHPDDSRRPGALAARCLARAYLNLTDLARADCEASLAADPRELNALMGRGFIRLRAAQYAEASVEFDAVLDGAPGNNRALWGRGVARLKLGDVRRGQADLDASAKVSPDTPAVMKAYGLAP